MGPNNEQTGRQTDGPTKRSVELCSTQLEIHYARYYLNKIHDLNHLHIGTYIVRAATLGAVVAVFPVASA